MLFSAADHPHNPPASWTVVKVAKGLWHLRTKDGGVLEYSLKTKKEGEALKVSGFLVDLYETEGRWYAGEPVANWRPYAEVKAEHDAAAARKASA